MRTEQEIEQEKKDFKDIEIYNNELGKIPNTYNLNYGYTSMLTLSLLGLFAGITTNIPFVTFVGIFFAGLSASVIFDNQIQKLILKAKMYNIKRRFKKMDKKAKGKKNVLTKVKSNLKGLPKISSKIFDRFKKKDGKKSMLSNLKEKFTNRKKKETKFNLKEKFKNLKEAFKVGFNSRNEKFTDVVKKFKEKQKNKKETKEENNEYIEGTNVPKPANRGTYDSDEEYVEKLSDHYAKYEDEFKSNESKIRNLKIVPSVCNAVFYEDGSYRMTKEQLTYLNKVQDKDIMTKENINNICNMYGSDNTNTNPYMSKVKTLKKVA